MDNISSMSISGKSGNSNVSTKSSEAVAERDEDLTKDNRASPIDLECNIQAERITKILDECLYKTKLSICLPRLIRDHFDTLDSIMASDHIDDVLFIFEQYDRNLYSSSLVNIDALEELKAGNVALKSRLNPELGHLIYILNSYNQIKPIVEKMIDEMKEEVRQDKEMEQNLGPAIGYLMMLEQFREQMVVQMKTTAAEELGAIIYERKLRASNDTLIELIKEDKNALAEENHQFEINKNKKDETVAALKQKLEVLNYEAMVKLKKNILDSDRQMVLATRAHSVKIELLREEEAEVKENYESLLRSHLLDEKNQRLRRLKVQTQLQQWLQKYDTEMSDKQIELDEFVQKFDEEEDKCIELREKIAEQDKEYIPLMEEKDKEYVAEMQAKLAKFQLEHAARVIQVAWRDVLANRKEKSKLKKLVRKMNELKEKEAAAAAAAAAAAERAAKRAAKLAKKNKNKD